MSNERMVEVTFRVPLSQCEQMWSFAESHGLALDDYLSRNVYGAMLSLESKISFVKQLESDFMLQLLGCTGRRCSDD